MGGGGGGGELMQSGLTSSNICKVGLTSSKTGGGGGGGDSPLKKYEGVTLHSITFTSFIIFVQLANFTDVLTESIASIINTECGNCGFSASNLANIIAPCNGNRVTYQAKISEWYSMDNPLTELLSVIERRFNTSAAAAVVISTANFVSGSVEVMELSLSPAGVSIDITTEVGSGDGDGSSGGSTTDSDIIIITDDDDVTTVDPSASPIGGAQLQTRPLAAVTVAMVAVVMGTSLFGL